MMNNSIDIIAELGVLMSEYDKGLDEENFLEKKIKKYDKLLKDIEFNRGIEKELEAIGERLKKEERGLEIVTEEIKSLQIKSSQYDIIIEQYKKDDLEKKKITKKLRLNELYRNSLKQLPYTIINKVTPFIEKKINDLLSIVTNFSVKMEVNDSKIDIYLDRSIYKGNMIMLNNTSGFERFISSLAIRLALLEITNLPKLNFIAIDEGWGAFDSHNRSNVRQIFDVLCQKFDFVLTMSHIDDIKQYVDTQINIKKDDQDFSNVIMKG